MGAAEDGAALQDAAAALREVAARLRDAAVGDEALAAFEPAHRRFGLRFQAKMRPLGRVWRLGVLLLQPDGTPLATGAVTRAVPPGHARYAALSAEARREVRGAAHRGPFREGETVHYDAAPVPLDAAVLRSGAGPLLLADDGVRVRWSLSAPDEAARPLRAYLDDRAALLLAPPDGA